MIRLGVDLGGTKIEIVALDPQGNEILRERTNTPQGDYPRTIETITSLVLKAESTLGQHGTVGVGTPGSLSPRNGWIRNANSTCLNGHPLQVDLSTSLKREIRIANDANCFTLSEAFDGAGQDAETVFGIILGTGVGGGIVHKGELLLGKNAIAGEWGHIPLPLIDEDDLPLSTCYCGRKGCIETYLSGPGLSNLHKHRYGVNLDAATIAAQAQSGNPNCKASLTAYETRLGRALAMVINLIDPDVIVLGGGLSNLQRLYENIPRYWQKHIFSDQIETRLLPACHGDSSGVRGAARLWATI